MANVCRIVVFLTCLAAAAGAASKPLRVRLARLHDVRVINIWKHAQRSGDFVHIPDAPGLTLTLAVYGRAARAATAWRVLLKYPVPKIEAVKRTLIGIRDGRHYEHFYFVNGVPSRWTLLHTRNRRPGPPPFLALRVKCHETKRPIRKISQLRGEVDLIYFHKTRVVEIHPRSATGAAIKSGILANDKLHIRATVGITPWPLPQTHRPGDILVLHLSGLTVALARCRLVNAAGKSIRAPAGETLGAPFCFIPTRPWKKGDVLKLYVRTHPRVMRVRFNLKNVPLRWAH